MADVKISGLPASSVPLAGTEVLPIVQGGQTRQVSVNNLTTGKAVSATQYTSTIATGTAPLVVASTTEVANLKAANATSADTANQVKSNATTGVLQVAGPGTGTTRVMTTPDANFTAARTDAAQTFTGTQTFSNGSPGSVTPITSADELIVQNSAGAGISILSPDANAGRIAFGTASNIQNVVLYGQYNYGFDVYLNNNQVVNMDTATSNVKVTAGNLIIGTSGKGIDFTATPGAGTSELLADYEEGTWTPTITAAAGTYTSVTGIEGSYTKVGNIVTVSFRYVITTYGTGTGAQTVGSLPFVPNSIRQVGVAYSPNIGSAGTAYKASSAAEFVVSKYDGTDLVGGVDGYSAVGTVTYIT